MVAHFYRASEPCRIMDMHLQRLAASHLETKFIRLNAEKSPFLTGARVVRVGCGVDLPDLRASRVHFARVSNPADYTHTVSATPPSSLQIGSRFGCSPRWQSSSRAR